MLTVRNYSVLSIILALKNYRLLESHIRRFNKNWYSTVTYNLVIGFICSFFFSIHNEVIAYVSIIIPLFVVILSIVLGIIRILKKDFRNGIPQIIYNSILGLIGGVFAGLFLTSYPYDYYTDGLEVPKNLKISLPKNNTDCNFIINSGDSIHFELYKDLQPGIYNYSIWLKKIKKGKIYLKAYELTKNDPLSAPTIRLETEIAVFNPIDTLMKFDLKESFKIYEGDWGYPYAATFEVWYKADNQNTERKLCENNYIIEGWQR